VTDVGNPYAPGTAADAPPPPETWVRRAANLAVLSTVLAVFGASLFAPFAVYFGHKALSSMKRDRLGLQHRGAAMVGVVFGWVLTVLLIVQLPELLREIRELLAGA
jgi:hypothetical protein